MASKGFLAKAAATSSRLTATILLRMSLMLFFPIRRICAGFQYTNEDAVHHHTRHHKQSRNAQGDPGAFISPHQAAA
jgi:hypothetical protein